MVKLSHRGRTVLLVAAVFVTLGFFSSQAASTLLIFTGIGVFLYVYAAKLVFELQLHALRTLDVQRLVPQRVTEGEDAPVTLRLRNRAAIGLASLELVDHYPTLMRLRAGTNAAVLSAPGRGEARLTYVLRPTSTGLQQFGRLTLIARDLAGIFFHETEVPLKTVVKVSPRPAMLAKRTLLASAAASYAGTITSRKKGEGFEFADIRRYVYGDEYRRIEWKASARTGGLMVREFEAETHLHIMIVLDASPTMMYGVAGETKLDYAARAVSTLIDYLARRGDFVGFTVFDGLLAHVMPLSRGRLQRYRILDRLASLQPRPESTGRFAVAVKQATIQGEIKGRTLFFIVTDLEGEMGLLEETLRRLTTMHHQVLVMSPHTPLFELRGTTGVDQVLFRIYTSHSWRKRDESVRAIERLGIPVFHVGPRDLFPLLLEKVEELRIRGGS